MTVTPEEQLLAILDVFADWFAESGFEGCSFVNVLLEFGATAGRLREDWRRPDAS